MKFDIKQGAIPSQVKQFLSGELSNRLIGIQLTYRGNHLCILDAMDYGNPDTFEGSDAWCAKIGEVVAAYEEANDNCSRQVS